MRPCLTCGRPTPGGSYCARHKPQEGSRAWRGGSTRAWRKLREQALERDGGRCVRCGRTDQLTVHHRVPLAEGDTMDLDGLTTLCQDCHHEAHQH